MGKDKVSPELAILDRLVQDASHVEHLKPTLEFVTAAYTQALERIQRQQMIKRGLLLAGVAVAAAVIIDRIKDWPIRQELRQPSDPGSFPPTIGGVS
ncbi:hypothetical protein HY441_00730 [Candidatus Microgenomates bacterium]|nr:hypothetical protein [Candidatus Microgenomates bacterium]